MEYLGSVILILFGIYMFSQPDNFYEYTKMTRKGPVEKGDPNKFDYFIIRTVGILVAGAGIVSAVTSFLS